MLSQNPPFPCKRNYGYMNFFDGARDHVMLDVGANMGLSMLPYYARGWRVIAFEPIPENVNTMKRNIFINGITEDRVALVHGAVTNMSGSLQVYAPRGRTDNTAASRAGSTRVIIRIARQNWYYNARLLPLRLDRFGDS